MSDRFFTKKIKRAALARADGVCECGCGLPLIVPRIRFDHRIPWTLTRNSSLANCQVLRFECDAEKTYQRDLPMIADTRRMGDFHAGISGPGKNNGPKLPCGRMSVTRKTIKGRVVERQTQAQLHHAAMVRRYGGFA